MDDPFANYILHHTSLNGVSGSVEENSIEEAGHLARLLPYARTRAQNCLHGLAKCHSCLIYACEI